MSSVPQDSNVEFTASDVLSTDVWSGKSPPPVVVIDVACTKIAVDLQNLRRESADATIQRNLQHLVDLSISDCAFLAFIGEDAKFGQVQVARRGPLPARGAHRRCPGRLPLAEFPARTSAALGAARLRDADAGADRRRQALRRAADGFAVDGGVPYSKAACGNTGARPRHAAGRLGCEPAAAGETRGGERRDRSGSSAHVAAPRQSRGTPAPDAGRRQ